MIKKIRKIKKVRKIQLRSLKYFIEEKVKLSKKTKILKRKIKNENGNEESEEYEVYESDSENPVQMERGRIIENNLYRKIYCV